MPAPSRRWLLLALVLAVAPTRAETLLVAVASNFKPALERIVGRFEASTGHPVKLVSGATGKHYAQIRHGAPFDLFFAADEQRPQRLEREGLAVAGSRFTYASGALVLWSPRADVVDPSGDVLRSGDYRRLAIANPRLAPYGRAARQALVRLGLWDELQGRLVRGENIAQAFHFVRSGNAELGLVAEAQLHAAGIADEGSWWRVPAALHAPIHQQCVLLRDSAPARKLLDFVRSAEALAVLREFGYAPG